MKSVTTSQFWKLYEALPEEVPHRVQIELMSYGRSILKLMDSISRALVSKSQFIPFALVKAIERWVYSRQKSFSGFG